MFKLNKVSIRVKETFVFLIFSFVVFLKVFNLLDLFLQKHWKRVNHWTFACHSRLSLKKALCFLILQSDRISREYNFLIHFLVQLLRLLSFSCYFLKIVHGAQEKFCSEMCWTKSCIKSQSVCHSIRLSGVPFIHSNIIVCFHLSVKQKERVFHIDLTSYLEIEFWKTFLMND